MGEDQYSSDDEPLVEVIAEEILQRQRAGETPTVEEYCERYPEHADDLRAFLPAVLVVEGLKPTSDDDSGTFGSQVAIDGRRAESIGDYRILREIGRGGMGVVFEAEQQSLGRRVALKVLPRSAAGDEKSLARFQREARAAAKMHHTNIVPVFEVGQDQEHVFYAMQLIHGQGIDLVIDDLKQLRSHSIAEHEENKGSDLGRRKPESVENLALSLVSGHFRHEKLLDSDDAPEKEFAAGDGTAYEETILGATGSTASVVLPGQSELSSAERDRKAYFHSVAQIGLQTARALSYAHARGIIHRDIKPSNLLLDTTGVVWVTDFGLAKTSDAGLTHTGDILGTIRYMSPERFKGQCDVRADVYALGLTLFELVTLKPAFESSDRLKLIDMVAKTEIPSPRTIDARIPRDLETIILKASDKDPRRRYQSADDMAEDLQRFVDDEPILARRTTAVERLARWSRRNPWLATAMSIAVMALAAVATVSTVFAQTQSELNGEIVKKNEALEQTIEDKEDLIDEVTAVNHKNEKLIRDLQQRETELKHNQSRLAEKQAEFVAEKGDIAEAMLWQASAYAMSEGQDDATRKGLLARLSILAQKMPRLQREVNVPPVTPAFRERFERARNQFLEERETRQGAQGTNAGTRTAQGGQFGRGERPAFLDNVGQGGFRGGFGGLGFGGGRGFGGFGPFGAANISVADDQELIPFQTRDVSDEGDAIAVYRFWVTRTSSWAGPPIRINWAFLTPTSALHSGRKLFAVQTRTPIVNDDTDAVTDSESPRRLAGFQWRTDIYDITTGQVISQYQRELETQPGFGRQVQMRFTADGSQLIIVRPNSMPRQTDQTVKVEQIDSETGKVQRAMELQLKGLNLARRFAILGAVSNDGHRLIRLRRQAPFSGGPRAGQRGVSVACYDLATGEQFGQSIEVAGGGALVLTPDAGRIAVTRRVAGRTRIEVHDVESGAQVGESIELDLPLGSAVQLLNTSPDRSQIIVGMSGRRNLNRPFVPTLLDQIDEAGQEVPELLSAVQVFDLTTGRAVTPPLPTRGAASSAVLSSRDQTLSVAAESGALRVWEFPESAVSATVMPLRESRASRFASFSTSNSPAASSNAPRFGARGQFRNRSTGNTSRVAIGRNGQILTIGIDNGIFLEKWDGQTGQIIGRAELGDQQINSELGQQIGREIPGPVSAGGRYLLIVRPIKVESDDNEEQGSSEVRSFRLQVRCWQTDPVQQIGPPITLEENQIPVGLSPDGNWIAIRTVTSGDAGRGGFGGRGRRFQSPAEPAADAPESTENEDDVQPADRARLQLLHRTTGELRTVPLGPFTAEDVRFSGDGRRLVVRAVERILLFDLSTESIKPIPISSFRSSAQRTTTRGRGFGFGTSVDAWAINDDGTLISDLVDETTLRIRHLATGATVGSPMYHPAAIEDVCFDSEGKTVVTACADGLIRQWLLPEQWSGDSQAVQLRVEQHAGVAFRDDDVVFAKPMTDLNTAGVEWLSDDNRRQLTLTRSQRDALQLRFNEKWEAADVALQQWSQQQPDAWLPLVLRIRPLVEQKKIAEAEGLMQQVAQRIDRNTLTAWIRAEFTATDNVSPGIYGSRNSPRYNDITETDAAAIGWRHQLLLGIARNDAERAQHLFELAKVREVELRFDEAVESINEAITLNRDSADMHFYRAHLMARLGRWSDALASRERVMELEPDNHQYYYWVLAYHLFLDDRESFWNVWRTMRDKWADSEEARAPERLAKPALILGQRGEELDQALRLADRAYKQREGYFAKYEIQAKGLAELRRGELELAKGNAEAAQKHFKDTLQLTQECFDLFVENNVQSITALVKFQEAIVLQRLGRYDEARTAYLDGVDHHNAFLALLRSSTTSPFADWLLAEGLRRNAEQLLDINEDEIGPPIGSTDGWKILYEEDFSEGISDEWTQLTGVWNVVDGAVCGILKGSGNTNGLARLQNVNLDLPKTVEIEYDTWWSEPLISACVLGNLTENIADVDGYRVALCHLPDPDLTRQGAPDRGYNIWRVLYPQGSYCKVHNQNESLETNHRYHVRIVRTPERITAFVDGNPVASTWILNQDATAVRLFARGPAGAKVYFDNLKIRAPESE